MDNVVDFEILKEAKELYSIILKFEKEEMPSIVDYYNLLKAQSNSK